MVALLFLQASLGLTVQDDVNLHPLGPSLWPVYLYVKPVYLCGAALWRYVITSTACLEPCGVSWPLCIVCTWCSLSIVWTYSLSPWCIVCTWCFLSIVWTYSLSPWCIVCAKLCGVLSDSPAPAQYTWQSSRVCEGHRAQLPLARNRGVISSSCHRGCRLGAGVPSASTTKTVCMLQDSALFKHEHVSLNSGLCTVLQRA